jgi:hypothetical protein
MTFANLEFYSQHTTQLGTKPKGENMEKDICLALNKATPTLVPWQKPLLMIFFSLIFIK